MTRTPASDALYTTRTSSARVQELLHSEFAMYLRIFALAAALLVLFAQTGNGQFDGPGCNETQFFRRDTAQDGICFWQQQDGPAKWECQADGSVKRWFCPSNCSVDCTVENGAIADNFYAVCSFWHENSVFRTGYVAFYNFILWALFRQRILNFDPTFFKCVNNVWFTLLSVSDQTYAFGAGLVLERPNLDFPAKIAATFIRTPSAKISPCGSGLSSHLSYFSPCRGAPIPKLASTDSTNCPIELRAALFHKYPHLTTILSVLF
jgi:hypothetical protein